jgi:O-antigen ligase
MGLAGNMARAAGLVLATGHLLLSAATLCSLGRPAQAFVGLVLAGCAAMALSRRGLAWGLFLLGCTLFLFGWQTYVYPAVAFGLMLDAAAGALAGGNLGRAEAGSGLTGALLGAVAVLALGSTLLLPWDRLAVTVGLFGPTGFFASMVFSPADAPAYGLAAALRLAVMAVFARELAASRQPGRFESLVAGIAAGLVTSIVFGLTEHFRGDHYLLHYRFTSLFANPGWFAEYLAVAAPLLLVPFAHRGWLRRGYGAACLGLCAGALVLTLARAGWIAGSLTFACAVWLYLRNGPLARFPRPYGHLPGLAVAGALVVGLAFWASGKELSAISRPINALLKERVGNFTDSPRPALFRSGLLIAAEGPIFGLGYESYARHYPVLLATPASWLGRFGDPAAEVFETSHNLYIQLVSGLGLAGLGLWLALVGRAGWVLWRRARDTAGMLDAALLVSLAAFHIYAFFQEMFYVPPVLFLLFVPLARAMARDGRSQGRSWPVLLAWAVALAGLGSYAADAGLERTAARLSLTQWRSGPVVYEGFYPPEPIAGQTMRWSVGNAAVLVAPGDVALTLFSPMPTDVLLVSDAGPLDRVRLGGGPVTRRYHLPDAGDGRARTLFIMPGSAVVPLARTGAPDPRRLGVAVAVEAAGGE